MSTTKNAATAPFDAGPAWQQPRAAGRLEAFVNCEQLPGDDAGFRELATGIALFACPRRDSELTRLACALIADEGSRNRAIGLLRMFSATYFPREAMPWQP